MKKIPILFAGFIFCGCATSPYTLVSGNRAGGSVLFSCNYEVLYAYCEDEISPDMWRQARRACINWGYDDATPFGGVRVIQDGDDYGRQEIEFQCIGDLES